MIRTPEAAVHSVKRACVVEGENHSHDIVAVYHGHSVPAYACGYHATYCPQLVFLAHNEQLRNAS